jgi:hypothetical protein
MSEPLLLRRLGELVNLDDWKDASVEECTLILRLHHHIHSGKSISSNDYSAFNKLYKRLKGESGDKPGDQK